MYTEKLMKELALLNVDITNNDDKNREFTPKNF